MNDIDQETLENIEKFGCSVMHIGAEGDLPPFSYSVGIQRSAAAPEILVIGLKQPLAHSIINQYNSWVREGEVFTLGRRYSGFLGGFDVEFMKVDSEHYQEYFGVALWYYQGPEFGVLQMVYPNTQGIWPWDPQASASFRGWQPLLSKVPE